MMLQLIKHDEYDIYNFSIEKDVSTEDLNQFYHLIELKIKKEKNLKVLAVLKNTTSLKDFSIFKEAVISKIKAFQSNIKYAILTNQEWMFKLVLVTKFFTPYISLKVFYLDEKENAIEWLNN